MALQFASPAAIDLAAVSPFLGNEDNIDAKIPHPDSRYITILGKLQDFFNPS